MAVRFPTPQFGINIHTRMRPDVDLVAEALHAERLGFDIVTLHGGVLHTTAPSYETWTLLTWLAARTTSIRLAPVVLALPNRHPTVLAKMAETLDRLSAGRLILALGSGAAINEPAYHAFGLAQRAPREKVAALEEAGEAIQPSARFLADTVNVGPGQSYDVIWTAWQPGKWLTRDMVRAG